MYHSTSSGCLHELLVIMFSIKKKQQLSVPSSFSVGEAGDGSSAAISENAAVTSHAGQVFLQSEATSLSLSLKEEGNKFAETGDWSKALNCWKRAIDSDSENFLLYELSAQAYLSLGMTMLAITAAEKCVDLNPNWSEGFQTLGRAQRELGELGMSLESYKRARALATSDNAEINVELEEVEGLCRQLSAIRAEKMKAVDGCTNMADKEACTCIYHLAQRIPAANRPIIVPVTMAAPPVQGQNKSDTAAEDSDAAEGEMQGIES